MSNVSKQSLRILSALALIAVGSSDALAGNMKDTGSMDATYAKREALPIADRDGHVLMLSEAVGTDVNTSQSAYLEGFAFSAREINDLTQGTGTQHGYVIFSKGDDSEVVKYDGNITTVMKDGHPATSFKGKWSAVNGTGRYAGIQGDGTYEGHFTAEDKWHVDWTGWHSLSETLANVQ